MGKTHFIVRFRCSAADLNSITCLRQSSGARTTPASTSPPCGTIYGDVTDLRDNQTPCSTSDAMGGREWMTSRDCLPDNGQLLKVLYDRLLQQTVANGYNKWTLPSQNGLVPGLAPGLGSFHSSIPKAAVASTVPPPLLMPSALYNPHHQLLNMSALAAAGSNASSARGLGLGGWLRVPEIETVSSSSPMRFRPYVITNRTNE